MVNYELRITLAQRVPEGHITNYSRFHLYEVHFKPSHNQ